MTPPTSPEPADPCEGFISLIVRAADDSLDADGRTRLDTHLATCAACRVALDIQRESRALLATTFEVEPPFGFTTRVVANLGSREPWLDRLDFRRWTWRVSPVAAGLLLTAWVVAAGTQTTSASEAGETATAPGVDVSTVLVSDAIGEADLVSLVWKAEFGESGETTEESPQ